MTYLPARTTTLGYENFKIKIGGNMQSAINYLTIIQNIIIIIIDIGMHI